MVLRRKRYEEEFLSQIVECQNILFEGELTGDDNAR